MLPARAIIVLATPARATGPGYRKIGQFKPSLPKREPWRKVRQEIPQIDRDRLKRDVGRHLRQTKVERNSIIKAAQQHFVWAAWGAGG
jgi:hypothetical protein